VPVERNVKALCDGCWVGNRRGTGKQKSPLIVDGACGEWWQGWRQRRLPG
jgi:hypothetical protein